VKGAATIVLALAITAAGASQAVASPGDDARISTETFDIGFNDDESATAFCDAGQTATGGGFGTETPPPVNVGINVSAPTDATELPSHTRTGDRPVTWQASAYSGVASDEEMKVLAICSATAHTRLVVKSFSVPPSGIKTQVVSCPNGQSALGGGLGLATNPLNGVYVKASGPLAKRGGFGSAVDGATPKRWEVAVYNGYSVKRKFQAIVICSKRVTPKLVTDKTPVNQFDEVELSASCPAGQIAFGGGVLIKGKPSADLQISEDGPLSAAGTTAGTVDGDAAVSWDGDVYSRSSKARTFKTLAVCG
jgi:hypothetical protein